MFSDRVNSTGYMQDNITLKEAVEYLLSSNESYQQHGANYIQHVSYSEDSAKAEVGMLHTSCYQKESHTM